MALYAIGDLHLHFQSECKAPMQRTERVWRNHEELFRRNCRRLLTEDDTLVLLGDHSWGKNLAQCEQDLDYIAALPGRKILLRGNHDMFWDAGKTEKLNASTPGSCTSSRAITSSIRTTPWWGPRASASRGPSTWTAGGRSWAGTRPPRPKPRRSFSGS